MRVAGVFWSRLAGPIVGVTLFFLMYRWGGGARGLLLGAACFIAACWWGERVWMRRADAEERRLGGPPEQASVSRRPSR